MVKIIRCFHNGMNARLVSGSEDEEFLVTNGVKQGCFLAPTLFSFLFSMMLLSAFKDSDPGIQRFRLTIGIKKTEVMFQHAKGSTANTPKRKIDGKVLNNVDSFTYLGSSLSSSNNLDGEVSNRIAKSLKCQYNLASQDAKHRWVDALLTQSQLRWSGHLVRMQDNRLPKQLFYSEQTEGHRSRGRPKLRYKDTLKKSLQKCDIDEEQWETMATNRYEWRQAIRKGTEGYENERQRKQVEKRVVDIVLDYAAIVDDYAKRNQRRMTFVNTLKVTLS
ncbi:uncharacterized protein LOC141869503 [Acropora palmata]|uniref:uncharacterized protein LOC141869503 n=1 Tax=Acropora palmata TaxID=6131 RepID=UPI003DA0B291